MECSLNQLPLESLQRNEYTIESDIWSTAVVIWELLSNGAPPFLGTHNDYANFGDMPIAPMIWPEEAFKLRNNRLFECWAKDVTLRPTMSNLRTSFEQVMAYIDIDGESGESSSYIDMVGEVGKNNNP